jgi:hypothetical protein
MNPVKLSDATRRLESLYWTVLREGVGPSCELLAIWRLLEEAAKPDADEPEEEDRYELAEQPEEEETMELTADPPQLAA